MDILQNIFVGDLHFFVPDGAIIYSLLELSGAGLSSPDYISVVFLQLVVAYHLLIAVLLRHYRGEGGRREEGGGRREVGGGDREGGGRREEGGGGGDREGGGGQRGRGRGGGGTEREEGGGRGGRGGRGGSTYFKM